MELSDLSNEIYKSKCQLVKYIRNLRVEYEEMLKITTLSQKFGVDMELITNGLLNDNLKLKELYKVSLLQQTTLTNEIKKQRTT